MLSAKNYISSWLSVTMEKSWK